MSVSLYLGGKVTRQSLPALQPPTASDAPALKRLLLPQGELAQVHDGEEGMRYIASIELKPGTVRGNHYHELKREWFYALNGELLLAVQDVDSGVREHIPLSTGDLVYIPPRVAHAFRVISAGHALEFSPTPFDPGDTYRSTLLSSE